LPRAIALLLGSLGISATITAINPFVTLDLAGWARTVLSAAELPQVLLDIVLGLLLFAASLHVDLESADFSVIFWQPVPFAHGRESTARIAGRVR
jgi:hypothetical protein